MLPREYQQEQLLMDGTSVAENGLPAVRNVEDLLRSLSVDAQQRGVRMRTHARDIPAHGSITTASVVGSVQAVDNPLHSGQHTPSSCEYGRGSVKLELLVERSDNAAGVIVDEEAQIHE